ncbi:MAG: metallopeptidase TldD-related protein [Cyanobacteria bacterium P01_A01_bin.105]
MQAKVAVSRQAAFNRLADAIAARLSPHEHFRLTLTGEESQFTRFNCARVRQTGQVQDAQLRLTLMTDIQTAYSEVPFTQDFDTDWGWLQAALAHLQQSLPLLPEDPYVVLPVSAAGSRAVHSDIPTEHPTEAPVEPNPEALLLPVDQAAATLLAPVQGLDFAGIYAGGLSFRGYADSAGQHHWFETTAYTLDYSLFDAQGRAVKGTLAGQRWNPSVYLDKVAATKAQLALMARPTKTVPRGQYRTYLAPAAMAEILMMFSWGGVSETELQQGNSAFGLLQRQEKCLSSRFSLTENFRRGGVPRFNSFGEVSPLQLPVIARGQLVNSLVSSRSAREYDKSSNYAELDEALRAPDVATGGLSADDILPQLGTGLYLSNLHYLNWSDHPNGRITGMTRYACFWVEGGELVAPIANLRFDDSLYRFLGPQLLDLTQFQEFIPNVDTYDVRGLGGIWTPGALVEGFTYTL